MRVPTPNAPRILVSVNLGARKIELNKVHTTACVLQSIQPLQLLFIKRSMALNELPAVIPSSTFVQKMSSEITETIVRALWSSPKFSKRDEPHA